MTSIRTAEEITAYDGRSEEELVENALNRYRGWFIGRNIYYYSNGTGRSRETAGLEVPHRFQSFKNYIIWRLANSDTDCGTIYQGGQNEILCAVNLDDYKALIQELDFTHNSYPNLLPSATTIPSADDELQDELLPLIPSPENEKSKTPTNTINQMTDDTETAPASVKPLLKPIKPELPDNDTKDVAKTLVEKTKEQENREKFEAKERDRKIESLENSRLVQNEIKVTNTEADTEDDFFTKLMKYGTFLASLYLIFN